jgi:hypothetical protein
MEHLVQVQEDILQVEVAAVINHQHHQVRHKQEEQVAVEQELLLLVQQELQGL